jgi:hypothetical protein
MHTHPNKVTIKDESRTVVGMTYLPGSLKVSKDQPVDGDPVISSSGLLFTLNLQAGRHKTSAIADGFNTACGGAPFEYAPQGGGDKPSELNFYFGIRVAFSTAQGNGVTTLYLAQGHQGAYNNWWLGGHGLLVSGPTLSVPIGDTGTELSLPLSGTHKSFVFEPGNIR